MAEFINNEQFVANYESLVKEWQKQAKRRVLDFLKSNHHTTTNHLELFNPPCVNEYDGDGIYPQSITEIWHNNNKIMCLLIDEVAVEEDTVCLDQYNRANIDWMEILSCMVESTEDKI